MKASELKFYPLIQTLTWDSLIDSFIDWLIDRLIDWLIISFISIQTATILYIQVWSNWISS